MKEVARGEGSPRQILTLCLLRNPNPSMVPTCEDRAFPTFGGGDGGMLILPGRQAAFFLPTHR